MNERSQREVGRPEPLYAAFLVRCWREDQEWHFLLENVATRERRGFDSVEALFLHLNQILKNVATSGEG